MAPGEDEFDTPVLDAEFKTLVIKMLKELSENFFSIKKNTSQK